MERRIDLPLAVFLPLAGLLLGPLAAATAAAQTPVPVPIPAPAPLDWARVPPAIPSPIAAQLAAHPATDSSLLLAPASLSPENRHLLVRRQTEILRRFHEEGLPANQAVWTYKQIACPGLDSQLLVRYERNTNGTEPGVISVVVSRDDRHPVRIVRPYQRRATLLDSASDSDDLMAVFNQIRPASSAPGATGPGTGPAPQWVPLGLCYATFAGLTPGQDAAVTHVLPAGVVVHVSGLGPDNAHTIYWGLSFAADGRLLGVQPESDSIGLRMVTTTGERPAQTIPAEAKPATVAAPAQVPATSAIRATQTVPAATPLVWTPIPIPQK